jgi:coenzyme F420-0:L-glutamate ligase/coenzyme F420-1:gamma-L-glutamate ligase
MRLTVIPLPGVPEVRPGDDLAKLLLHAVAAAGEALADGDVLAVTSKVVAKAEGRIVALPADPDARRAAVERAIAGETVRVVARRGPLVIAETAHGFVGANAMVDASNTGDADRLVLLPEDPDASAAVLRAAVATATGADVAVVVTDTLGRPWRVGQTDVAVGVAGMGAIEDYRGRPDADGRLMEATEIAVADEVASAAELVKGKTTGVAAALLRGVPRPPGDGTARDLVRDPAEDLFRSGSGPEDLVAFVEGRRTRRRFAPGPVPPEALRAAVAAAAAAPFPHDARPFRVVEVATAAARERYLPALEAGVRADLAGAPVLLVPCLTPDGRRDDAGRDALLLAAGGAVEALLLALHAHGLGAAWAPSGPPQQEPAAAALDLPPGWLPLGTIALGRPDPEDAPGPLPRVDLDAVLLRR